MTETPKKQSRPRIFVAGIPGRDYAKNPYPAWRYHEWYEPIQVNSTEEDDLAKERGYLAPESTVTSCRYLFNWRFDLEDMSARQLAQFARDNFEVELPVELGREKLFKLIWKLHSKDPRNSGNVVLMAQSHRMRYDETVEYIKRVAEFGEVPTNCVVETFTEEFEA